jgi:hypothetical protein
MKGVTLPNTLGKTERGDLKSPNYRAQARKIFGFLITIFYHKIDQLYYQEKSLL